MEWRCLNISSHLWAGYIIRTHTHHIDIYPVEKMMEVKKSFRFRNSIDLKNKNRHQIRNHDKVSVLPYFNSLSFGGWQGWTRFNRCNVSALSIVVFNIYFLFFVVDKKRYGVKVAHKRKSLIGLIEGNKDVVVGRNGIHIFLAKWSSTCVLGFVVGGGHQPENGQDNLWKQVFLFGFLFVCFIE